MRPWLNIVVFAACLIGLLCIAALESGPAKAPAPLTDDAYCDSLADAFDSLSRRLADVEAASAFTHDYLVAAQDSAAKDTAAFATWFRFLHEAEGGRYKDQFRGVEQATYNGYGYRGDVGEMTEAQFRRIATDYWVCSQAHRIVHKRAAMQVADAYWGGYINAIYDLQRRLCVSLTCDCSETGRLTDAQIACINSAPAQIASLAITTGRLERIPTLRDRAVYGLGWRNRVQRLPTYE